MPRALQSCPSRTGSVTPLKGDAVIGQSNSQRLRAWCASLPSKSSTWTSLTLALFLLWYDLAFRLAPGPLFTLPVEVLGHPRADAGWLCALAGVFVAASACTIRAVVRVRAVRHAADELVSAGQVGNSQAVQDDGPHGPDRGLSGGDGDDAGAASKCGDRACGGMHAGRSLGARLDVVAAGAALLCAAGTVLVRLGAQSLAMTTVGGFLAGASFALLAVRILRALPPMARSHAVFAAGCGALAVCAVFKLVFCALDVAVVAVLVCLMPVGALACALQARACQSGGAVTGVSPVHPVGPSLGAPARPFSSQSQVGPFQLKSHLTEVGFCFLGLGLYMGIIGFANDSLEQAEYLSRQFWYGMWSAVLALVVLALSMRANPDGPYVMLPVLLGTAALVFVVTTSVPSGTGELVAHVVGRATDNLACVLGACAMAEAVSLAQQTGRPALGAAGVLAACAAALLVGILLGGVLMSTVGLGTTSIVLVAVSLLYGALLSLGFSVQQRARDQFVIVRNPADMARIAHIQAQAIVCDLGNLTPRETEVLPYLLQHQGPDAIAEKLGISRNTAKTHIAHIYEKAGVNTRAQLVDLAASKTVSL